MQRIFIVLACLTVSANLGVSAPALKDPKKEQDTTRILGQWVVESISVHGDPPENGQASMVRFSKDGTCGITNGDRENGAIYSLNPSASPSRMKWLNGPEMTEWLCLYEFTGNNLKVAFVHPNSTVPEKIEPTKSLTIYYLTRQKE